MQESGQKSRRELSPITSNTPLLGVDDGEGEADNVAVRSKSNCSHGTFNLTSEKYPLKVCRRPLFFRQLSDAKFSLKN